ncbi:ATP-binding cassette domain-containing protein [Methanotorris igneus]|uniref:ATP-binding cassette domain-containing protein n=1 Tax=Methanotorris igneus TaxID=2189 RepID=UPI001FE0150E|nr:ATP-binding cassette domain-containing protein [Methanotorris igneus]
MAILKVENIHKSFGGIHALNGVNLDVEEKTITALIGPNGSGKSTLFNVISGFIEPDKGKVYFKGEDITKRKPHIIAQKGLIRTFQTARIYKKMTVLENMLVAPKNQLGEKNNECVF